MRSASVKDKIIDKLQNLLPGTIMFAQDFTDDGSNEAVRKELTRLVNEGFLKRLSQGVYVVPKELGGYGHLLPNPEEVAFALARRDKARIIPTGEVALWKLGLSTQVPLNYVYLTDGPSRVVKIEEKKGSVSYNITFKHTSPKNFAYKGKISSGVIQALKAVGERNLTQEILSQIEGLIMRENLDDLNHDLGLAPAWIKKLIKNSFNSYRNEGLDKQIRKRKN